MAGLGSNTVSSISITIQIPKTNFTVVFEIQIQNTVKIYFKIHMEILLPCFCKTVF